ncbi:SGNH/GDSL hydrolase family protein [Propionibacteriaceae bacterium Y1923]|uniref:SGNH/GDSL hydrolase family protein n=1 Tax=Aestuariimicrobium sp. Y1814 TaxID=3418742 RepID=UPI003C1C9FD0
MNWGILAVAAGVGSLVVAGLSYAAGKVHVNGHVPRYAEHWGHRPDEHPADVLHYVALGDSAAQGVGASSVEKGYVSLIGARLARETGRPVSITNLSVSGAVSDDVVSEQLGQLDSLPFTPDIITIAIGGNDVVYPRHNTESFAASLTTILERLPTGSFVGDVPWFTIPGFNVVSGQMATRARQLITDHGHHLVEIHRASRSLGYWKYYLNVAQDLFHPNDVGYAKWADLFWEQIVESGTLERLRADQLQPA